MSEGVVSHSIYRHLDPRTGETRYVGRSVNPGIRYVQHMATPGNDEMRAWHDELNLLGLKPVLDVIETGIADLSKAKEREWYWISHYLDLGCDLTNYVLLSHVRKRLIKCLPASVWEPLPLVSTENIVELEKRRSRLQIQCVRIISAHGLKFAFCRRSKVSPLSERDLYILHESDDPHRDLIMRFEEMDAINSIEFHEMFLDRTQEVFSSCGRS